MDTGWRRNKYGGWFNINEIKKNMTDKTTNQYMNEKIRDSVLVIKGSDNSKQKTYELYHGSYNDFNEFEDEHIGERSLGGLSYGKGHYFSGEQTDIYGQKGYKVKVALNNPFEVQEWKWSATLEKMGYDMMDFNRPDPSDFLASKGYDGTILKDGDRITEVIIYTNKDKKIKIIDKVNNY